MNFEPIDMDLWHRKEVFTHFIRDVKCVISLTAEMDVTALLQGCKKKSYRFYPTYIYLVSKVVNRHKEFRMGYDENGAAGFWAISYPSYVVFNPEDELFTRLITPYTPDFQSFYGQITADIKEHKMHRAFEVSYPFKNTFDISCLPWISYQSFDMHIFDSGTYLAPVITWGKYHQCLDRIIMPLSMQVHHAAADGFHVARFFSELQEETERLGSYLLQSV